MYRLAIRPAGKFVAKKWLANFEVDI